MSYLTNPENLFKKKDFYFEALPVAARAAAAGSRVASRAVSKAAAKAAPASSKVVSRAVPKKTVKSSQSRSTKKPVKQSVQQPVQQVGNQRSLGRQALSPLGKAAGAAARGVYNVGKTVGNAALRTAKNVLTQSAQGGNLYQGGQQYQQPVFQQQYQQQYQNPQNVQAAQQNQDNLKVQLAERDKIINTIKSNISTLSRQTQSIVQSINTIQNVINKL